MKPEIRELNHRPVLYVDDRPFYIIGGEVHNSDASSPAYMEKIWKIADDLGMNTLFLPASWELCEPEEDVFDFSIIDELITQAREWKKRIVFLWFGSWKNAEMMYAPAWVKKDRNRFKRAQIIKGEDKSLRHFFGMEQAYYSISYLCREAMQADGKAFAQFMKHLKEFDSARHTVIGVQVENETGLLGAAREHSDDADRAFDQNVPEEFVKWMRSHTDTMYEDVKASVLTGKESGSWREVFGENADEIFSAYHISGFVNYVAEQGKKEYGLPMFANCWLAGRDGKPGDYPSGGPVTRMHEVWRYRADAIDVLCPDIYVKEFMDVCDDYSRNQPLLIPEAAVHSYAAPRLAYCIGHYHAMGYSPFGFDDIGKPFSAVQGFMFGMDVNDPALKTPQNFEEYAWFGKTLHELMPLFAVAYGTDALQAVAAERRSDRNIMDFGKLKISAVFNGPLIRAMENGVAVALREKEDEYYILAYHAMLAFSASDAKNLDILEFEEGIYKDGKWIGGRRLNGDEAAVLTYEEPKLLRLKIFTYND